MHIVSYTILIIKAAILLSYADLPGGRTARAASAEAADGPSEANLGWCVIWDNRKNKNI